MDRLWSKPCQLLPTLTPLLPHPCTYFTPLQGQDLSSGNLTAPAIFALASSHDPAASSELLSIIESEFMEEGSLSRALELVCNSTGGMAAAQKLAREEADMALSSLKVRCRGRGELEGGMW
jgi:geranylgeranyl pyrophosphate synthase